MSITEAERHEIYELIKQATNDRVANNVMTLFPPVGWADVATKTDLHALEMKLDGRIDRLEGRIDGLGHRMDAIAADLRSEMHQSIRNQTWALVVWTSGWTTALAGLIIALGR